MGYKVRSIYDLSNYIGEYDAVFNTVPERIIDEKVLDNVNKNTLIVDLASKPGGVDFNSAKEKKIKVVWALSLPGKVAPVSAGRIIKDTVISIAETHSHKYKDIFSGYGGGELL